MAKANLMSDELYEYLISASVPDWEIVSKLREETSALPMASMQISLDEGNFLSWLVTLIGAKRALEVGTFTGASSLWIASALPDDGLLVACDVSEEWTSLARGYWEEAGLAHKIDLRLAPALETLDELIDTGHADTFDLAFIDADKANYGNYYERALELVRPGGVVAIDNVLWGGKVIDPSDETEDTLAIRSLNAALAEDQRVKICMLPVADGVTLAIKR